jgi:hypothetical protein
MYQILKLESGTRKVPGCTIELKEYYPRTKEWNCPAAAFLNEDFHYYGDQYI